MPDTTFTRLVSSNPDTQNIANDIYNKLSQLQALVSSQQDTINSLKSGSAGQVSSGVQATRVIYSSSPAQTVPTGATTILQWDTVDFNIGDIKLRGSGLVAPSDGSYLIVGQWGAVSENGVASRRQVFIYHNGAPPTIEATIFTGLPPSSLGVRLQVSEICRLNKGDTVQLAIFQDSGTDLQAASTRSFLSMALLSQS